MRKYLLIIVAVFLLVSVFGAFRSFTLPVQIEEQAVMVNYEQRGEFDYRAYLNASYLFGDFPLEIEETAPTTPAGPPTNPKYPAEIIDWFSMTFNYGFVPDSDELVGNISEQVEIKAVLTKTDRAQEEIILVPERTMAGNFTVDFRIGPDELAKSSRITITANVYTTVETAKGPIFESFTQSLSLQSKGPLVEVDKGLTATQRASFGELSYEQIGAFNYTVRLKPDSPFGAIVLEPPSLITPPESPPPSISSRALGPEDPVFLKLFDRMDMSFSYYFESDRPLRQISEEVKVNVILEDPGVWSKTFILVPPTNRKGDFSVTFPLNTDNFSYFRDVFAAIQRETGVSVPNKLTIRADVHTVAQTDFGPVDKKFSQTLSTTLGGNIMKWEEKLVKSEPGTIELSRMIPNPDKLVGLSVNEARITFPTLAGIFLASFVYLVVLYMKSRPERLSPIDEEVLRARKKHKGVIVDVIELPEYQEREMVISFSSLDELVKTADSLFKPVLHKGEPQQHTYCVIDGSVRYEYILTADNDE